MATRFVSIAGAAALLVLTILPVHAATGGQFQPPPQPVTWSLAVEPAAGAAPASVLRAIITAKIDEGWHVYAPDQSTSGPRPVRITVPANPVFSEAGTLDAPEPQREMDEAFGDITASYVGTTVFRLPVTVAAGTAAGTQTLKLEVTFQACDGRMCLPAKVVKLEAPVAVSR